MGDNKIQSFFSLNLKRFTVVTRTGFKKNWIGLVIILIITLAFFYPVLTRVSTYNAGGDAMFNAWTIARDQHCILRENCPNYVNGNIFYPNKDSMLYSETQLSAGLLTLPFYFINPTPVFSENMWTIISFLLAGIFMYLLAKYLSKGNELFSIMAGLAFEFAPYKIVQIPHLQSLSIFYLPLIVLFMLKYMNKQSFKYLVGLFIALVLLFYASWYQMVFVLLVIMAILVFAWIFKLAKTRPSLMLFGVIVLALIATLPLALKYVSFSKSTGATFGASQQNIYSSSLADYFIPFNSTLLGHVYYSIRNHAQVNSYSPDGVAYSSYTLYLVAFVMFIVSFIHRKRSQKWSKIFRLVSIILIVALLGFLMSLGPFLKIKASYIHTIASPSGPIDFAIALPYLLVDKLLPQLSFIRAINRATVIVLFSLCCLLALVPLVLAELKIKRKTFYSIAGIIFVGLVVEMATWGYPMSNNPYLYKLNVPNVYKFIKDDDQVNDIVVLAPDSNYPGQPPITNVGFEHGIFEEVLWAGYYNKNTFNGYSGYFPPNYFTEINEFDNFQPSDLALMRSLGLRYILVDKELSTSEPNLVKNISGTGLREIYHDKSYVLFKI
jgi:hypothetical protein